MSGDPPSSKGAGPAPKERDELVRWVDEEGSVNAHAAPGHASPLVSAPLRGATGSTAGNTARGNAVLKPGQKVGALGVADHFGTYGRGRYAGATGEGELVGVKGVALDFGQMRSPTLGDHVTDNRPGNGIGVHGISGAGTGVRGDSRTGVGVAGKSRSVAGIEGQSELDVGGVFVSGSQAQVRLYPTLNELPASGRAGDLIALLANDATLDTPTAELWFCVRGSKEQHKALWQRLLFDTLPHEKE